MIIQFILGVVGLAMIAWFILRTQDEVDRMDPNEIVVWAMSPIVGSVLVAVAILW